MSGICGIVALDGSEPTDAQIRAMTSLLERRGPDGTHHWCQEHVALGHTLLATTPEALHETLPLTELQSGCTITADVRLDNREELIEALGLEAAARVIGDGELILRAYLKWGEDCPKHLLGDFAFAIWDPRAGRLFCARDHMGMRQLIYCHVPGRLFAFATEARAVLTHPEVPKQLNEGRIADFLEDYLEGLDFTSTFFEQIFRLPPAHSLIMVKGCQVLQRYWTLQTPPTLHLDSDEAYAKRFREVFTSAVESRLRSAGPVASMLSGGLDSGTISAIASRILAARDEPSLITFSCHGPDPETCPETAAINHAIKMPGIDPRLIRYDRLEDIIDELIDQSKNLSEPFDFHMTILRAIYIKSSREGINVVLSGGFGDAAFNHCSAISRLLRSFRWVQGYKETKRWIEFYGLPKSAWQIFPRSIARAFCPSSVITLSRFIKSALLRDKFLNNPLVADEFARSVSLAERKRTFQKLGPPPGATFSEERVCGMIHTYNAVGCERYDRVAAQSGVEPRDPFMDLRVIEFCLSLPADQLLHDGWPKFLLRHSMKGFIPDPVRWKRGRHHVGWRFTESMIAKWPEIVETMMDETHFPKSLMSTPSSVPSQMSLPLEKEFLDFGILSLWLRAQRDHVDRISPDW